MKLIAKQISLITVIQADGRNHTQCWLLSQHTKPSDAEKFLTISKLIFLNFQPETEQQQRVGVICQNSGALAGAWEDY